MGLVQTALGSIVVLTTSTINRVMVVELALPAMLPGALVALHYALQFLRPRWGYGSDTGGRRTPWIMFGMVILALGGAGAAAAVALMETNFTAGLLLATLAFTFVGIGVGAAGTSLLALLATRVDPARRAPAATIVWLMMIAGFVVTTIVASNYLDPFTTTRLMAVTSTVSVLAVLLAALALWGVEPEPIARPTAAPGTVEAKPQFREALAQVWEEPQARRFTIFVFVSMLAYSMQDLILEPFAGIAFGLTPGQSTRLAGLQHARRVCRHGPGCTGGQPPRRLRVVEGVDRRWLHRVGRGPARARGRGGLCPALAAQRHGDRPRFRQWRFRGGCHRHHDGSRRIGA